MELVLKTSDSSKAKGSNPFPPPDCLTADTPYPLSGIQTEKRMVSLMLRAAVYGYGNIGRFTLEALLPAPTFFRCLGVVSRSLPAGSLGDIPVVRSIEELSGVDVAVLCSPSRAVPDLAAGLLSKGICTVDSFDIHTEVWDVRQRLMR